MNDYGHDVAMWIACVGGKVKESYSYELQCRRTDALLMLYYIVDSCGGTFSGGVDDPPPHLFIEYAPIIIQWTKV